METEAEPLRFSVEGSRGDEYDIQAWRAGGELLVTCTCAAASLGRLCRHRVMLLRGETDDLLSDNEDDVQKLEVMLRGSSVEAALERLTAAEDKLESAKRAVASAKLDLGQHWALGLSRPLR